MASGDRRDVLATDEMYRAGDQRMAYEVLFVCTGNVCRSPAAERLLRRHLDLAVGGLAEHGGVRVSSAGTGALVGEPISPPMAALIAAAGADAGNFLARQLSPAIVRDADLVVTMTNRHRNDTVAMVPAAVQRTFVLGELAHMLQSVDPDDVAAEGGPATSTAERLRVLVTIAKRNRTPGVDPEEDILDPYGRSNSVYRESFQQIQEALEPILRLAVPLRAT
jgi:protein-tyrosine phosphatase